MSQDVIGIWWYIEKGRIIRIDEKRTYKEMENSKKKNYY